MDLTRSESTILDLAGKPDGYLVALSQDVIYLREIGFLTIAFVGEGFVIVRAVQTPRRPVPGHTARGRWAKGWRASEARAEA